MRKYYFTSESVTEGHPDKICDKISDKILDELLKIDPYSHTAVEVCIKDNFVLLFGEVSTNAIVNYAQISKDVLKDIGYIDEFDVMVKISSQSPEINNAVSKDITCAGDQGIMFGFACNETEELMPLPITLANKLAMQLSKVRKEENDGILLPDGKTQVTVEYLDNKPNRIDTIIVACQHCATISKNELEKYIINKVIHKAIPSNLCDENTKILINTSGSFIVGGPFADSGLTGRKIIVDTYGGMGRVGGGCFSGKDSSKVDRSAAYYARYVAKNIVKNGFADKVEIGLSYSIGMEKPISLLINTFDTNKTSIDEIEEYIYNNFDFSVENIINELDLRKPIYYDLAAYGHFGRENYSWEKCK